MSNYIENKPFGWVSIYRSLTNHWLYREKRVYSYFEAWIDLLLMVSHKKRKDFIERRLIKIDVGQSIKSMDTLAKKWGWGDGHKGKSKVRRFLKKLEDEGMIQKENLGFTTRITIINFAEYQQSRINNSNDMTHARHMGGTSSTHIEHPKDTFKTLNNIYDKSNNEKKTDKVGEIAQLDPHLSDLIHTRKEKALSDDYYIDKWKRGISNQKLEEEAESCAKYYIQKDFNKKKLSSPQVLKIIEATAPATYILELDRWLDKSKKFKENGNANSGPSKRKSANEIIANRHGTSQ